MSPETGTGRSQDNPESGGTMQGKELGPWLRQLMRDRTLALSSLSRVRQAMPPISARVWRRLGSIKPRSIDLSIIRPLSVTAMIRPAGLSSVWRRLINMPLLRKRRPPAREIRQASLADREEPPVSNPDWASDESVLEEYPAVMPQLGRKTPNIIPSAPPLTVNDSLLSTRVTGETPADVPRSVPSSSAEPYRQTVVRAEVAGGSLPARLDGRPSRVSRSTSPGRIQEVEPRLTGLPEDSQLRTTQYLQPFQNTRQSDGAGVHHFGESGRGVGETEPKADEPMPPAPVKNWLERGWSSIAEGTRQAAGITRSAISQRIIPLVHPVSVLRRSPRATGDKPVKYDREVTQSTNVIDSLAAAGSAVADSGPGRSPDISLAPPGIAAEENLTDDIPAWDLSVTRRAVPIKPEGSTKPMEIMNIDKPVLDLRSPSIVKRPRDSIQPGAESSDTKIPEAGSPAKPMVPESPLMGIYPKTIRTSKIETNDREIPAWRGVDVTPVTPAGETIGLNVDRIEIPLITPYATENNIEKSPVTAEIAQIQAPPVQRYWKTTDMPTTRGKADGEANQHDIQLQQPGLDNAVGSSPARLIAAGFLKEKVSNETGVKSVVQPAVEGSRYLDSQLATERVLTPARKQTVTTPLASDPPSLMRQAETESGQSAGEDREATGADREAAAPDMEAIARDVYRILKRTIRRERERTYGFS